MSTSGDSRTIDLAKTASIDMMALNNKVVNMRQVVKRTKVQVINKLCKNIAALKKKKGTDEQKTQNLRKAERLIEEIDSIKRLKEDKVTKYSLANTLSFTDVCKASLSAGPRAMARLADHSLMQKVVTDFRTQHSDWKDLAAYLLVKQTGRRFKTKKQKQSKKLSRSVENIHASEMMTKAYIQERFGEDGLKKAELRFERKRKRAPFDKTSQSEDGDEENLKDSSKKMKKDEFDNEPRNEVGEENEAGSDDEIKASGEIAVKEMSQADGSDKGLSSEEESEVISSANFHKSLPCENESEDNDSSSSENSISNTLSSKKVVKEEDTEGSVLNQDLIDKSKKAIVEKAISDSEMSSSDDENADDIQESSQKAKHVKSPKKKSECVVKELDIDKSDSDISDEGSSAEDASDKEESKTSSDSAIDNEDSVPYMSNRQRKKAKVKNKIIPSILTNKSLTAVSDPFFAGSDEEDDGRDAPNDFDEALSLEPGVDEDTEFGSGGNRSMFYNPHGEDVYRKGVRVSAPVWSSQRGGRGWQKRGRGGSFSGPMRGRGGSFSGQQRGRGMSFRGSSTRVFRGSSRDQPAGGSQSFGRPRFDSQQKIKPEQTTATSKQAPASSEKLHPSWEASKKRKAEQSGIQAFKGSKITFDDDD